LLIRVTLALMRTILVVRLTGDEASDWAAALSNDADAFAAIFDRHHDRVYRHALRLTEVRAGCRRLNPAVAAGHCDEFVAKSDPWPSPLQIAHRDLAPPRRWQKC
jgi:hypothetical protein